MEELIKQLEIYRLKRQLSQTELAQKLGVTFPTVNRWLNRKAIPSKTQQFHIIKMLYPKKTDLARLKMIARINIQKGMKP